MLNTNRIQSLRKMQEPLLTVYIETGTNDASKHAPAPSCLAWLKKEANSILGGLAQTERDAFLGQLHRVEEFLHKRHAQEKSLVIFAGARDWEVIPLQVGVEPELRWGKPAVTQLLWLVAEHRPYCIVVVDRGGARFHGYRLGELWPLQEMKFDVDISQWKKEDLGHVARPGIKQTYGMQRDVFEHRMDAQFRRLYRQAAAQAIRLFRQGRFSAIFVVGPDRPAVSIASQFPAEIREEAVVIKKDLGKFEPRQLLESIEPEVKKWVRNHETAEVKDLLDSGQKAVVGIDETLVQLQKGKVRTLMIARGFDARLRLCGNCGWIDSSADPVCPVCRGARSVVALRDVLPDLISYADAELDVINGDAAGKFKEAGGMGGWLRQFKQRQLTRAAASA